MSEPTPSGRGLTYTGNPPITVGQSPDCQPGVVTGVGPVGVGGSPDFNPAAVPRDHNGISITPVVAPDGGAAVEVGVQYGTDITPDTQDVQVTPTTIAAKDDSTPVDLATPAEPQTPEAPTEPEPEPEPEKEGENAA